MRFLYYEVFFSSQAVRVRILEHAPRKHELEDAVSAWLVGQGPSGTRIDVISACHCSGMPNWFHVLEEGKCLHSIFTRQTQRATDRVTAWDRCRGCDDK